MKILNELQIRKEVYKCTKAYLKYAEQSKKVESLVLPYFKKVRTLKGVNELLEITTPVTGPRDTKPRGAGEYLGRFYLLMLSYKLNPKAKKDKEVNQRIRTYKSRS